jgi:hypothetical protein
MNKFTKIISVMLAVMLIVTAIPFTTFAATTGDVNGDGNISAVDARLILQVVAELKTADSLQNTAGADVNDDGKITAVDARIVLQMVAGITEKPAEPSTPSEPSTPNEPETPSAGSEKAQMAALFNAETAKAASGKYNWERNCRYVSDLSVSGAPISVIKPTVDKFLGIGNTNGNQADAGKNALIAMKLTENDIKEIKQSNGQITLILNDSPNPTVGGDTPFSHVSNDIVTGADAEKEIKNAISSGKLNSFYANYYDVSVTATVDSQGVPTGLIVTYKMYASLEAKAGLTVNGNGTVETTIKYANFNY